MPSPPSSAMPPQAAAGRGTGTTVCDAGTAVSTGGVRSVAVMKLSMIFHPPPTDAMLI